MTKRHDNLFVYDDDDVDDDDARDESLNQQRRQRSQLWCIKWSHILFQFDICCCVLLSKITGL